MRFNPSWNLYTDLRLLEGMSMRQLHAVAEDADCNLRGFAPSNEAVIVLSAVMGMLDSINRTRPVGDRCVCWVCLEPFPDEDPYEV